jgi:uncharacterized protein (DUF58 family)
MSIRHPNQITGIENLELLARQVVEGFIIGLHKSPYHGFSVEFAEHRLYNPGESLRGIDWKVFARTDKLFVKKFEEETNLRCQIVLDHSSSMHLRSRQASGFSKLGYSAVCAAAILHLLKKQRDAAGLSLFSDQLEWHTECRTSGRHFQLLMSKLENLMAEQTSMKHGTDIAAVIHQIAEAVHRRSLILIFSDMFTGRPESETLALFQALQHLKHNKHEVIVFHVTDREQEQEFSYENRPMEFVDLETGEKIKLQTAEVQEAFRRQSSKYLREIELRCLQYKMDFIPIDINSPFQQALMPFFLKRSGMR